MAEEVQFHLDSRADALAARGLTREEAYRRARLEFGAVEAYQEAGRDARGFSWLHDLAADVRYAFRVFRRQPGFVAGAILSLALGIGANTLIFSVVNGILLRPLPIADPGRVVSVQPRNGTNLSFPAYRDLRDLNTTFSGLMAYRASPMDLEVGGVPERVWGYLATGNYFDVLGVKAALGRVYHADDARAPGAAPYAVLSDECWRTQFGADPHVPGRVIRINRTPFTVLGVAPRGFFGSEVFYRPALWVPMMMEPQVEVGNPWLDSRRAQNAWVAGRLKPGVSAAAATDNLDAIGTELEREYPNSDVHMKFVLAPPGLVGRVLRGPVSGFAFGLLLIAALVLAVACMNLATALTARGADRRRELAIRASIGASRWRIVRQLLAESVALALAGGVVGTGAAALGARLLSAWHLPLAVPVQFDVHPDARVLVFAALAAVASGLFFGIAPARQAWRTDPHPVLKGAAEAAGAQRWRLAFRDMLVGVQVALCCVLLAACFSSLRGLQQALTAPIGMRPDDVVVVGFDVGLGGYGDKAGAQFERRARDAVAALPGVADAAYANSVPLNIDLSTTTVFPDDQPGLRLADALHPAWYTVSPGFFRTLGMRLLQGRSFTWHDDAGAPRVAVVNETFAREVLHSARPVGKRFRYSVDRSGPSIEVIGVVEDGKYASLTEAPRPVVFDDILQSPNTTVRILARSARPAGALLADMRSAIRDLDPHLPLYEVETLRGMLAYVLLPNRLAAVALSAFGLLALALVATGLYGVVSYAVARRQREIGIRVAIGARSGAILRAILARVAVLLGAGAAAGLVLALAASRVIANIVYQASPGDPVVLASSVGGLLLIGLLSCWLPARRALRIDPITALRSE